MDDPNSTNQSFPKQSGIDGGKAKLQAYKNKVFQILGKI